jgi:Family of unknown function (DUF5677)
MSIEIALRSLEERVDPLERIIRLFAARLTAPTLRKVHDDRGFRFESPDVRHFCLLKAARALSAFNASIELARKGYVQEMAVLMRTLIECTTHIEFVLEPDVSEEHRALVSKYIGDFFADHERSTNAEIRQARIKQGTVHATLGRSLDKIAGQLGDATNRRPTERLYSNVYRVFSNYVHAKYPECMDMYGGRPGQIHVRGMSGTPKEGENLETLQSFAGTLETCFVRMIQSLSLRCFVEGDPIIGAWYDKKIGAAP